MAVQLPITTNAPVIEGSVSRNFNAKIGRQLLAQ
jgi:hypothetical protein